MPLIGVGGFLACSWGEMKASLTRQKLDFIFFIYFHNENDSVLFVICDSTILFFSVSAPAPTKSQFSKNRREKDKTAFCPDFLTFCNQLLEDTITRQPLFERGFQDAVARGCMLDLVNLGIENPPKIYEAKGSVESTSSRPCRISHKIRSQQDKIGSLSDKV